MSETLKPVRCGCGGKARIVYIDGEDSEDTFVECIRCRISIPVCPSEAEAVTTWNRAMGATDMNVGDKERTAKVSNQIFNNSNPYKVGAWIGTCECGELVSYSSKYCHMCGAKLEWNHE